MGQKKICPRCHNRFDYTEKDTWWDYGGTENAKVLKCPYCQAIMVIKWEEEPDREAWYYSYVRGDFDD